MTRGVHCFPWAHPSREPAVTAETSCFSRSSAADLHEELSEKRKKNLLAFMSDDKTEPHCELQYVVLNRIFAIDFVSVSNSA